MPATPAERTTPDASRGQPAGPIAVVAAMFAALEAGDIDAIDALYADDLIVWTNFTKVESPKSPSLKLVAWLARSVQGLCYEIIARHEIADGVVQQHVLHGTAPDGTELHAPACLVVKVRDGRIVRIDEYLNVADVAALMAG